MYTALPGEDLQENALSTDAIRCVFERMHDDVRARRALGIRVVQIYLDKKTERVRSTSRTYARIPWTSV